MTDAYEDDHGPKGTTGTLPLAPAQLGLWFAQRLAPTDPSYSIAEYAELHGPVDRALLADAVRQVVAETDALRLSFGDEDGVPFQRITPAGQPGAGPELGFVDLSALPAEEAQATALARMREELARPADIGTGPLARMTLYRLGAERHLFHQQVHHLALDGYGAALALRRIAEVHTALAEGAPAPFQPLPLAPLLAETTAYAGSAEHGADRAFWRDYLADAPAGPAPSRSGGQSAVRRTHVATGELSPASAARLRDAARQSGVAWPTLFLAAEALLRTRAEGTDEALLGLPVTGRRTPLARSTPAMLSGILPLRLSVAPADRVRDLLRRASAGARSVLRHQRYAPQELRRDRDEGAGDVRRALSGTAVNILAFDGELRFGAAGGRLHNLSIGPVEDLTVAVHASFLEGGLRVDVLADARRHTPQEAERHHAELLRLLEYFAQGPDVPLGRLSRVDAAEERRLLDLGTGQAPAQAAAATASGATVGALFGRQAALTPRRTALVAGAERLSFEQLDERVRAFGVALLRAGAGRGSRVAVALPRRADLIAATLAVLRIGAVHVPVDPAHPAERIGRILDSVRPSLLVADARDAARVDPEGRHPLLDPAADLAPGTGRAADEDAGVRAALDGARPEDPAYLLHTSGSTGRPKGVLVGHRALANLYAHHRRSAHALAEDALTGPDADRVDRGRPLRVALTAPLSFDAAWDPVLWMVAGHELHLVDEDTRRDPEALTAHLRAARVDAVETTPGHLRQLMAAGLLTGPGHRPRVLALGGEAVDQELWEELAGDPALLAFNFYGPTETTVDATTARITGTVPGIGRPVDGARTLVLDQALQLVPHGQVGELYIAGEGVALGYAGRPGASAARFLPDPYGPPGGRMYRTGDLARWGEDGTLRSLGRADGQIKVRGHRVETGEIESALRARDEIADAVVTLLPTPDGSGRLAAHLVPAPGAGPVLTHEDLLRVRDGLARSLPDYMVPAAYAVLPGLPLTAHGKVDTTRLPVAVALASAGGGPRTADEKLMCALFAEVLDLPEVGREDDFFLLGGHSLLATRLVTRIRSAFGVEATIRALFTAPTPAGQVALLAGAAPARTPVTAREPRPARLPLSHGQRRLWLLERMGGAGRTYHLPLVLHLEGELDRAALEAALGDLVRRHESLRTVIVEPAQSTGDDETDGPYQRVLSPEAARVPLVLCTVPSGGRPQPDPSPFALGSRPPLRAQLFATGPGRHTLILTLHHIAADAASMVPLTRDLAHAYAARRAGRAPEAAPLPVQYADYALWQRDLLGDTADPESLGARQLAHWSARLAGLPPEVGFPADHTRPLRSSGRGGTVPVRVDAEVHRKLLDLAAASGASPFMVLHAALAALMHRLGAGEDLVLGTPVEGRGDVALTDLVGFFVNTLVLRLDASGAPAFRELLDRARDADLEAYAHQELPFERLVEELAPARSLARHPLFQVMLSLDNTPVPQARLDGLRVRPEPDAEGLRSGAKFDLTWDLAEERDAQGGPAGIGGVLEFSADLFTRETAARFSRHLTRLLGALLDEPDRPVTDVPFLTDTEYRAALDEEAGTHGAAGHSPAATPATVLDVFADRAAREPGRTAVVAPDGRLGFGELGARADALARRLVHAGVRRGDRVAVALAPGTAQVVAFLAVLRAGAVHVPLDPDHPAARNRLVLETAAPRALVTTGAARAALPYEGTPVLVDGAEPYTAPPGVTLPAPPRPGDAAYVLFTSGSTGRPKGVVVEHGALANLLAGHRERLMDPARGANDGEPLRVALTAAATFDASLDPLLWMIAGHELHLMDAATRRDPEALTAFLHRHAVDVVETTPSFLEQLRSCGLFAAGRPHPRVLALGGEPLGGALWRELAGLRGLTVWNLYGPTEATVDSVMGPVTAGVPPHLGRAVRHTRARVLDARLRPVAPGVAGELYLSGPGLARGYDRSPAPTAARFLPDPFAGGGRRMYRTGDLVRRRAGRLEYLGRADGQLKVRGFRVETGEVETALGAHPAIVRAAVTVREGPGGAGRLVAWFVAGAGPRPTARELRAFAAERLPAYMVPAAFAEVPGIPLGAHGKVDFAALPEPVAPGGGEGAGGGGPRSAREEILCALFAESLGQPRVAPDDDFFELGGHSLLATRLTGRIRAAFGVELPVRALFEASTPAALAGRLAEAGAARPALRRGPRPARTPLSPAQRRLWFLHQLDPDDAAYHIAVGIRLDGDLDVVALRAALHDVVTRHESLRTVVAQAEDLGAAGDASGADLPGGDAAGEPWQRVLDTGDALPGLPVHPVTEEALAGELGDAARRPFSLATELPLRAELFRLAEHRHVLLVTVHHIAADGWSLGPLAQDLAGAYAARADGRGPDWAPLPVQYADYALWQRELLGREEEADSPAAAQLAFWRTRMAGAPVETELPTDRPRPATPSGRGGSVGFRIPAATTAALDRLAKESTSSVFMVLHSALAALLHRVGAGEDVTVGTPVAGRGDQALDELVGFFVNTLALRLDLSGAPSFRELLRRAKEADLEAYAHQELPFERLVEELAPARSLARHPLFQVMLTLNNQRAPRLELPGLRARMDGVGTGTSKFDLSFSFTESTESAESAESVEATGAAGSALSAGSAGTARALEGTLEFSADLFDADTARRLADWFPRLLERAVTEPDTPLAELPLVDAAGERRLLALGAPGPALPSQAAPVTVLEHFAATVAASRSDDIAVEAPDGRLTFPELDLRSDRVAALLGSLGAVPGEPVAVLLPRSTDALAALLGVLKAGAVHTPVDEGLPGARIEAVLRDAGPRLVVTTRALAERIPAGHRLAVLDDPATARALDQGPTVPLPAPPGPQRPAYLLHTSGSTGRPKGVLVGHRSLGRLLEHHRHEVFAPAVRQARVQRPGGRLAVALTTSLSFDAAWDPILWMIDGHRLHLVDDATRHDPEALVAYVRQRRLDVLETTPSHVRHLLDAGLLGEGEGEAGAATGGGANAATAPRAARSPAPYRPSTLILGGEAVPEELWRTLRAVPGTRCWNFYGPTEATVDTLEAPLADTPGPALGTPVTGTLVRLLDGALRPVPEGVPGELYLAGDSLALGYHGRPGDSARAFLPDPYGAAGSRMYRTGDRAVRRPGGALEFAGRADSQVKIRGLRVEPDEIAAVLEQHPGVVRAVVTADTAGAEARLLAHVATRAPGPVEGLRAHVASRLPAYMVPARWSFLDRLPLTPNGKVDLGALPEPGPEEAGPGVAGRGPRSPREDLLCTLFAEVLGREQVGIDEDFFALGGHSLLAARAVTLIRAAVGLDLSIRTLFEAPTVAALAARLQELDEGAQDDPLATLLPLRAGGGRPPLFCVHPAGGLAWSYAGLLPHLDRELPVYGLQTPNLSGEAPFPESIPAMAALYVAELRTVQPHGPYHLLGWSFGGNVAQEMAAQLESAGETVALLTLLDAFPLPPLDELDRADRATVFRALLANLGVDAEAEDTAAEDTAAEETEPHDPAAQEVTEAAPAESGTPDAVAARNVFRRAGSPLGALEPATLDRMVDNFARQARLMRTHRPSPYGGRTLFFTATEDRPADSGFGLELWAPYLSGPLDNHDVATAHARMMQPAARGPIGETLARTLRALSPGTAADPTSPTTLTTPTGASA